MEKDGSESEEKSAMNTGKKDSAVRPDVQKSESCSKENIESVVSDLKESNKMHASKSSEVRSESQVPELEKNVQRDSQESGKRNEYLVPKLEDGNIERSSELEEEEGNDAELEDKTEDVALELEDKLKRTQGKRAEEEIFEDETISKEEETAVPLLVGESVSINLKGGDPSVKVHTKENKRVESKKRESPFLSPIRRLQKAWSKSTNVCDFFLRAVLIIFSTLGWILCIGGIPFVSIAMFIIGSVYIDDCKVQPNIPIYLIVGGVFGTFQHFIAFWNKCIPEESQGRFSAYRIYYSALDGAMTLFLLIWFILGCVWVYGVKEVEFEDTHKDEYCHKALYYFSFWLLNFSFILIAVVAVLTLGILLCIIVAPKNEAVV